MIKNKRVRIQLQGMLGAIVAALVLGSCANSSHVVVFQHSNFGLNVGTNPATQKMHARIGIRNEVAVVTPKTYRGNNPVGSMNPDDYKLVSSYVSSRFRVESLSRVPEVAEIVATGTAAEGVAAARGAGAFLDD